MHVDFLTLACLHDDLDALLGARVQQIVLPDELSIGLELYAGRRQYLFLTAHPQNARVLLTPDKLRRGVETETPLLLQLRKRVRGARLVDIIQPDWERILKFHFEGPDGACQLVAEIMGKYSNLILVGPDGNVLEAVKRIGSDINRVRVTLPAHPYHMPPTPPNRQPPTSVSWSSLLAGSPPAQPLQQLLTGRILAISPTLAREVAARLACAPSTPIADVAASKLAAVVAEMFAPVDDGLWQPHLARDDAGQILAFTSYQPRQFAQSEPAQSISSAMEHYFESRLTGADSYAKARQDVQELIDGVAQRIERTVNQLRSQLADQEEIKDLRQAGELLLAYQTQVSPGDRELTVPDHGGQLRTLALDPTLSPVENAQAYFRRYDKAQKAAQGVPRRIRSMKTDRAYLEQLAVDLALAQSRPEIEAVREALTEAGWIPSRKQPRQASGGPLQLRIGGFTIWVGRNARQNDLVTFKRAKPEDLWLHVRGQPGAHVIIKTDRQPIPDQVRQHAAQLAAYYSPARKGGSQTLVDLTQRRYVRRASGGKHPGLVKYRNEETVWVETPSELPPVD